MSDTPKCCAADCTHGESIYIESGCSSKSHITKTNHGATSYTPSTLEVSCHQKNKHSIAEMVEALPKMVNGS